MFLPPGFVRHRWATPWGTVAYAQADPALWTPADAAPLLFVHGFGGGSSSYEWSKVYPAFAADGPVMAPDLIGWGASDRPDRPCTPDDYQRLLAELVTDLCPQPPVVVASSLSAALMVRVAVAHPERLRGLFLVAPTGLADFGADARGSVINWLAGLPGIDRALYQGAIATAEGIRFFLRQRQFANPDYIAEEMVAAYLASAQQPRAEVAALAFVRGDLSFDLANHLPQLTTPTAILWGEAAQLSDAAMGQRLAALNPSAIRWFETLPGVGLTPQLEQPGVTIARLRRWLAELDQS